MIMKIPTRETAKANLSAPINGLMIPFKSIPDSVHRFCRPLNFHRLDSPYDLAYSGSSLLFRYRGRNFQLATKHQLRMRGLPDLDPALACLLFEKDGSHIGLSPDGATQVRVNSMDDLTSEDILLLEYENQRGNQPMTPHFLQLDLHQMGGLRNVPEDQVCLIFSIGYPLHVQSYEPVFDESFNLTKLDIVARWAKLFLEPRPRTPFDLDTRLPLGVIEKHHGDIGDPQGWSGAPVFFLWLDPNRELQLGFAGMITHASGVAFGVYPAEDILKVVNRAIDTPYTSVDAEDG